MNKDFPRIITMLRKEKNLSQKQVSSDLGISQALLSHYEKGIRECGLDFLIRIAEYYEVSCDFLLGRTPERSGATLNFDDIPEAEDIDATQSNSSMIAMLNKKILCNSLAVIFDILSKAKSKRLTAQVSNYLMIAVYKIFRLLYCANPENHQSMFSVNEGLYQGFCDSYMGIYSTKLGYYTKSLDNNEIAKKLQATPYSPEILSQEYPQQSSSLFNLIQHAESKIKKKS